MYAITLAAAAIIWPFIVAFFAKKYGPDVSERFLERSGKIPSTGEPLTRESLEKWFRLPANGPFRKPYAYHIMFLDLVYICFVGGFLVFGSLWLAAGSALAGCRRRPALHRVGLAGAARQEPSSTPRCGMIRMGVRSWVNCYRPPCACG
jgi:hypothetical protein